MRIAQINNNLQPASRESSGSIGVHVGVLADELCTIGHDVTLYGTEESATKATLVPVPRPPQLLHAVELDEAVSTVIDVATPDVKAGAYDVVHSHIEPHAYSLGKLEHLGACALTCAVLHKDPPAETIKDICGYSVPFIAFSNAQANRLDLPWLGVVHHGIDTDFFRPEPQDDEFSDKALVISRIERGKNVHRAIAESLEVGLRVDVAGPVCDPVYFKREVMPLIDGTRARYLGVIKGEQKRRAYAEAAVTVTASELPETFCLVLAESMACGTPNAALDRGACSEVIEDGVGGYTASSADDLSEVIQKAVTLDREAVRMSAVQRFSVARMALEYSQLYQRYA